jgi:hypothetical protein
VATAIVVTPIATLNPCRTLSLIGAFAVDPSLTKKACQTHPDQLAAGENRSKTSFAGKPTANAARKPQ